MRILIVVAAIALMASSGNAFAQAEPATSKTVGEIPYGPQKQFSGFYFSNFEASLFYQCGAARNCESSWLNCERPVCEDLERHAKALHEDIYGPGGSFEIVFLGRESEGPTPLKYMQDRPHKVLLEKLLELKPFKQPDQGTAR